MSNSILANVDMVLAISEDTINYQFFQLFNQGLIENEWKLLVRKPDYKGTEKKVLTGEDKNFEEELEKWQNWAKNKASIENKFKNASLSMGDAKYFKISEEYQKIIKETAPDWHYGWVATIEAPTIEITKDISSLLFTIKFKSGRFYVAGQDGSVVSSDMGSDIVYAFKVPIQQLDIEIDDLISKEAQQAVSKIHQAIPEAAFSMQSLFLDFDNANILNFDAQKSNLPKEVKTSTLLQAAVDDYFKLALPKKKNPYVLGYGVKLTDEIEKIKNPKALFQPTALRFSTSYSENSETSSFNFLMMCNGRKFPQGNNVGILKQSLLESPNYSSSEDGVFAIDYDRFQNILIEPFVKAIGKGCGKDFSTNIYQSSKAQQWTLSATKSVQSTVQESIVKGTVDAVTSTSLNSTIDLQNNGNHILLGCSFNYDLDIKYTVGGINRDIVIGASSIAYEVSLSTQGTYESGPDGHKGKPGTVDLSIQPGTNGSVDFKIMPIVSPTLGYTKAPKYEANLWAGQMSAEMFYSFNKDLIGQSIQKTANTVEAEISEVKTKLDNVIQGLSIGKVVLPLGQLYTFKHIQLYNTPPNDNNAVTFDVSYAPVSD